MEFSLWPLGFMELLQNNNHQAVNKMKWNESKIEKYNQKPLGFCRKLYVWLCVCVCGL